MTSLIAAGLHPGSTAPRHTGFKSLAEDHVFTFAGPCAYTYKGAIGDAALWFHPDAEKDAKGGANPFDTGGLEKAMLRPWDANTLDERHAFYVSTESPVPGWRSAFEAWLRASYSDPKRYLESDQNRMDSGCPDQPDPHGLAAVNKGSSDRRAWTWEVRFFERLPFDEVEALLVPRRLREVAQEWRTARKGGRPVQIKVLGRDTASIADDLFRESGRVCESLMGL